MKRHVLLVGLPGAGKTVVGRRVARRLSAKFVDVDETIERESGESVRALFATRGEPAFRALEATAVRSTLAGAACVVAPGGGWAAQPGNMSAVSSQALTVWLDVDPEIALQRCERTRTRPLLDVPDPRAAMQVLLAERRAAYAQAEATVETSRLEPDAVAKKVAELARSLAGW